MLYFIIGEFEELLSADKTTFYFSYIVYSDAKMIMRGGDESMCECSAVSMLDSMVWGKRREQILICKDVQIDSI